MTIDPVTLANNILKNQGITPTSVGKPAYDNIFASTLALTRALAGDLGGLSFTAGGDLSGTNTSQTVIGLQTNSVKSETLGAAQDGYALTWDNSISKWRSNAAPSGSFTPGGDLSGTNTSQQVISITGSGGFVNIASTGNIFNWNSATTSPGIKQANLSTASGTGQTLTIQAQNETGTGSTGGTLTLTSGTGTNTAGPVLLETGGTTRLTVNASGVITIANLGTGVVHSDSSGNLTSSLIVNADISSSAAITVSKLAAGTAGQVLLSNATPTPTWTTFVGDVTNDSGGGTSVISITGASGAVNISSLGNILTWNTITTAPGIKQADKTTNSGTGATLTIQAQNETGTTSTGGTLALTSGTGTTAAGPVLIRTGGTTRLTANASGVITIANLSTGVVHSDSSGNLTSSLIVDADISSSAAITITKLSPGTSGQVLMSNATPAATWTTIGGDATISATGSVSVVSITGSSGSVSIASTGNILTWVSATTAPGIKQSDLTTNSATGADMTIQAQNETGTTSTGGRLILQSGTGTTAAGNVLIKTGSSTAVTVKSSGVINITNLASTGIVHSASSGDLSTSLIVNADISSSAAMAVSKIAPGTSGQVLMSNATPATTWTTIGGDATISATGSVSVVSITGDGSNVNISFNGPTLNWDSATTAPTIKQADLSTASGTGQALTIQAQNETGSSSTGGTLTLTSGTGRNGAGTLTAANAGPVLIQTGGTTRLTANASGVITVANLGTGLVHSDSSGNLTSSTLANADIASGAIAVTKLTAGTSAQILMNNSTPTPTWTSVTGDITLSSAGAIAVVSITGGSGVVNIASTGNILTWNTATTAPGIKQADKTTSSGTGAALTIQAQNETGTTSTGGALNLTSGTGTTANGALNLQQGGTTFISINAHGITYPTKTITANYTIDSSESDYYIFLNASSTINLTLPAPTAGRTIEVFDITGALEITRNVTVVRNGSENINGIAASRVLKTNWGHWTIVSDGTDWWIN